MSRGWGSREEGRTSCVCFYITNTHKHHTRTQGNAACIYTSSGEAATWFSKKCSSAMVGINIGVPVPREPFSFGGCKASRFGDGDITGDGGIEFFTERRKVTTKW